MPAAGMPIRRKPRRMPQHRSRCWRRFWSLIWNASGKRRKEGNRRDGELMLKEPEDRRKRFPVRFRRSEGTQVFPPVAKGLPSRDFVDLTGSQFRVPFPLIRVVQEARDSFQEKAKFLRRGTGTTSRKRTGATSATRDVPPGRIPGT